VILWKRKRAPAPAPDPESANALHDSQERLRRDTELVFKPHRRLIEQNNVTVLMHELVKRGGRRPDGHSAAAG
jgi:hypothetical protein